MVKGLRGSLPEQEDLGSKPAFSNYKVKGGRKKLRTCQIVWCQRARNTIYHSCAACGFNRLKYKHSRGKSCGYKIDPLKPTLYKTVYGVETDAKRLKGRS